MSGARTAVALPDLRSRLNALMVDGHVESFKYNPRDPTKSSFLRKNINVNYQP
jgi:prepilin-type processing-associated H-X9-DG protein